MMMAYSRCSAIVVLSERVEYTVQRALFRSLGTALGGAVSNTAAVLLLSLLVALRSALSHYTASAGSCPDRPAFCSMHEDCQWVELALSTKYTLQKLAATQLASTPGVLQLQGWLAGGPCAPTPQPATPTS